MSKTKLTLKELGWSPSQYDKYLKNTFVALNGLVPELTEKMIAADLEYWQRTREGSACGTTACFGGWCANVPHFKKQGLHLEADEHPNAPGNITFELVNRISGEYGVDTAGDLFGNNSMFAARNDYFTLEQNLNFSHWHTSPDEKIKGNLALIKNRLKVHLKELLSITP